MKLSVFLLCISASLLLVSGPVAGITVSVTCPNAVYTDPIITYSPPGPYGTIYVESKPPGAVIYLNGDNRGHAPVTITGLWPGTYTISAELAGYQDFSSITTISGRTRSSVYCPLVPDNTGNGLYVMSTPADANVYLDGVLRGKTPLMISDTAAGPHSIQLRLSGYAEWKSTVESPVGGTKSVSAILNRTDTDTTRGLRISSNPGGAKVILDGLEKGITPITLNNIAPGIHIVEIGSAGYTSWKSTVDVPEMQIKDIAINLTPKSAGSPGRITVSSSPDNALVFLDGDYVGRTTSDSSLNLDSIPPGEHTVVLSIPGYQQYSMRANVLPNQLSVVKATLMPVSGTVVKGALSLSSDPSGATIILDNKTLGISPLMVSDIDEGNHQVTIQMDGYQDYSASILVTAGTTSTVLASLTPVKRPLKSPVLPLTALGALGIIGFLTLRKYH